MNTHSILIAVALALSATPASSAAEIAGGNGGFEANTFTNPGFSNITDLWETTAGTASGWTFSGTGRWFMKNSGDNSGAPHDGTSYLNLALGEYGGYGFSASTAITGLTVGKSYAVEFFASERVGSTAGTSFSTSVDTTVPTNLTVTEASLPAVTTGLANYVKQTLTFVATATSHTFTVSNAGTGSSAGFLVDDFRSLKSSCHPRRRAPWPTTTKHGPPRAPAHGNPCHSAMAKPPSTSGSRAMAICFFSSAVRMPKMKSTATSNSAVCG